MPTSKILIPILRDLTGTGTAVVARLDSCSSARRGAAQEVLGSAIGINLLTGLPLWAGCIVTGVDTFTFLAVHYLGVRYLEALICLLIATMTASFFTIWSEAPTPGLQLVEGWAVPTLRGFEVEQAVGTLGAVVMPHNLYLHSGLVLSRRIDRSRGDKVQQGGTTWWTQW